MATTTLHLCVGTTLFPSRANNGSLKITRSRAIVYGAVAEPGSAGTGPKGSKALRQGVRRGCSSVSQICSYRWSTHRSSAGGFSAGRSPCLSPGHCEDGRIITLIFVQPDGTEVTVPALPGDSVMKTALDQGVLGISADCNGSAACATCHAYFTKDLLSDLSPMEAHEDDLLDFAATERQRGSRLSCQVIVSERFDGQRIILPEAQ